MRGRRSLYGSRAARLGFGRVLIAVGLMLLAAGLSGVAMIPALAQCRIYLCSEMGYEPALPSFWAKAKGSRGITPPGSLPSSCRCKTALVRIDLRQYSNAD